MSHEQALEILKTMRDSRQSPAGSIVVNFDSEHGHPGDPQAPYWLGKGERKGLIEASFDFWVWPPATVKSLWKRDFAAIIERLRSFAKDGIPIVVAIDLSYFLLWNLRFSRAMVERDIIRVANDEVIRRETADIAKFLGQSGIPVARVIVTHEPFHDALWTWLVQDEPARCAAFLERELRSSFNVAAPSKNVGPRLIPRAA